MQYRKDPLVSGQFYHVFNRSISGYVLFNNDIEFSRILRLLELCRFEDFTYKYSAFIDLSLEMQANIIKNLRLQSNRLVDIVAFCIMPTHIHLLLKQTNEGGISKYMGRVLNGYSKYFNTNHKRTGPLWTGRFKSVLVKSDEQLLHLTRYIHLNPFSAGIVGNTEDWKYSSYIYYVDKNINSMLCDFEGLFNIEASQYRKFVNDRKSYQRDLSIIKSQLIDEYYG